MESIGSMQRLQYLFSDSLQKRSEPLYYVLILTHSVSTKQYSPNQEMLTAHTSCSQIISLFFVVKQKHNRITEGQRETITLIKNLIYHGQ